jgi:hypothetical protein
MRLNGCLAVVAMTVGSFSSCSKRCTERTPLPHPPTLQTRTTVPAVDGMSPAESVQGMAKTAEQYLVEFEKGKPYVSPLVGLIVDSQPDVTALKTLERGLSVARENVRLNIVRLLVDLGLTTDPSRASGCEAIRNADVIRVLAISGLARADAARDEAIEALRSFCAQSDLAVYGEVITRTLELAPTQDAFLLVAKAKPPNAQPVVRNLFQSARWKDDEEARIAYAALGERELEDEFLKRADEATEGRSLSEALRTLSLIGTHRCLLALATRLRSPMTIHIVGAFEKSIRLDVLVALLYHFPYESKLNPNGINDDSDYEAAELFCTRTLGVKFTEPRPPFLTIRGYPF